MAIEENEHGSGMLTRVARMVVPWVGLIIVVTVVWSLITDYRTATNDGEATMTAEPTQTTSIPAGQPFVRVLSDGLNLRAEPSTASAVVKVLDSDKKLLFVEERTGWYHVKDVSDGAEGWVAAGGRYSELVKP